MNKINRLFDSRGERKLLSLYFCAGAPSLEMVPEVLLTLQDRGIDMVEVGIPFSDPLADGPVIQAAGSQALRGGASLEGIFRKLEEVKGSVRIPLILMGYLNVIMSYGYERFFDRCVETGVSGCIIPDLPFKDYLEEIKPLADKRDIRVIMMITPETSEERIRLIDSHTDGFIYMVSTAGITGARKSFDEAVTEYFQRVDSMGLRNPRMIGFGISNRETLERARKHAAGAIIGSKFVSLLSETGNVTEALDKLYQALEK